MNNYLVFSENGVLARCKWLQQAMRVQRDYKAKGVIVHIYRI